MEISLDEEKSQVQIRSELANMSFEKLQELKEKLGAKVYNEAVFGTTSKKPALKRQTFKRENKNRPREMSSKKPVPLISNPVKPKENEIRDPRFDSLCGPYNPKAFERSYSFVNDIRQKELVQLKEELKNTKNAERKEKIAYLIQRIENQNREKMRLEKKEAKKIEEHEERIKLMKEGKKPEFVRKSEKKVMDLVEQYEELKKSGKLEKHITKHRKRNTQKAKKKSDM